MCLVSTYTLMSSDMYLPLCCCNDVIRAGDRSVLFFALCMCIFVCGMDSTWFSCNNLQKLIEMSLLKDFNMCAYCCI